MRRKQLTVLLLILACAVSASVWAGNKKKDKKATAAQMQMDARQRALHATCRLPFDAVAWRVNAASPPALLETGEQDLASLKGGIMELTLNAESK